MLISTLLNFIYLITLGSLSSQKKLSIKNIAQPSTINPYDDDHQKVSLSTKSQTRITQNNLLPNKTNELINKRGFNKSQSIKEKIGHLSLSNINQKQKEGVSISRPHSITRVDEPEPLIRNNSLNNTAIAKPKISANFQLNWNFDRIMDRNSATNNNLIKMKDYEHSKTATNKLLSKHSQARFNKIRDTVLSFTH